jgi:WD domain, G-beta repeat
LITSRNYSTLIDISISVLLLILLSVSCTTIPQQTDTTSISSQSESNINNSEIKIQKNQSEPIHPIVKQGHSEAVISVAISPDGKFCISGSEDETIKLWEMSTGRLIRTITGDKTIVYALQFSPDSRRFISGIATGSRDGTIKIFDISSGKLIRSIAAHTTVNSIDFSSSGQFILSVGYKKGVRGAAEEIALSRLSRATGSALIAASRDDQFAQEFAALGQGALTKALLDGLKGDASLKNGQITVGSLKGYVESALPGLTEMYAGQAQYQQVSFSVKIFQLG